MEFLSFNASDLKRVASGARPSNDSRPIITVTPTYNKIDINGNASALIGMLPNERIVFFDHPSFPTKNRWFVAKTEIEDGSAKVANVGGNKSPSVDTTKSFSYAGIWAKLHQSFVGDKETVINLSTEDLVEQGYMGQEDRTNKKGEASKYNYGKNRIILEVVAMKDGEGEPIVSEEGFPLFNLQLVKVEPYDGRDTVAEGEIIDEVEHSDGRDTVVGIDNTTTEDRF